jgi:hypothetical protein
MVKLDFARCQLPFANCQLLVRDALKYQLMAEVKTIRLTEQVKAAG